MRPFARPPVLTSLLATFLLGGCGPQFLPKYEAGGSFDFDGYWSGTSKGCSDAFITSLEGEPLVIDGEFPEFDSHDRNEGTITLLGLEVAVEIEAADVNNSPHIYPVEPGAVYAFEDGTEWSLGSIDFHAKHSCGECKDQLIAWMFTSTTGCNPNVVYAVP